MLDFTSLDRALEALEAVAQRATDPNMLGKLDDVTRQGLRELVLASHERIL